MPRVLHITNGDSAVGLMREGGISGDILPWRDVLHDGPVPGKLDLEALSRVRARFLADRGWGDFDELCRSFAERDGRLIGAADYDRVVLWFEHDLYDQLQILQILDGLGRADPGTDDLAMICTERYLGHETPVSISTLVAHEQPVSVAQLKLARESWAAFRQDTPLAWRALLEADTSALPFLHGAIARMNEEYPDARTGLSRTERVALERVSAGVQLPGRLFGEYQLTEERMFMGDWSFWAVLDTLLGSRMPLLQLKSGNVRVDPHNREDALALTAAGRAVLDGELNWLDEHRIDRWIGGVHLVPDSARLWARGAGT